MRKLLIIVTILLYAFNLYSQEVDFSTLSEEDIYKIIDDALEVEDESLISLLGTLGSDFPGYSEFEEYILDEAEKLITSSDLAFPLLLVEAVLYNNLENPRAQELYTIIINKQIEDKERLEDEKLLTERRREEVEEISEELEIELVHEEFVSNIVAENNNLINIIDSYKDANYSIHYVSNSYYYPLITRFYSSEVYDGYNSREATVNSYDGQAMDVGFGVKLKSVTLRADMFLNMTYDNFFHNNIKQFTGHINISVGLSMIEFPLFLRTGFFFDNYQYNEGVLSDVAITELPSPSVGVGLMGYKFLKILKLDFAVDTLLASIYTSSLGFAVTGKTYVAMSIFQIGKQVFELKGGVDAIFLNEGGLWESSITPRFGLGVSSYE